jgi:hypothetical protein
MPRPQSQPAIEALQHLESPAIKTAMLSFVESSSIRTSAWAVRTFGARLLVDKVQQDYKQDPLRDFDDKPVPFDDLVGAAAFDAETRLLNAQALAEEVESDLTSGWQRIKRGYPLETITVRGTDDAAVIIGSLERAVEVNPENLAPADQHFQAEARYILDHMIAQTDDSTESYLL